MFRSLIAVINVVKQVSADRYMQLKTRVWSRVFLRLREDQK